MRKIIQILPILFLCGCGWATPQKTMPPMSATFSPAPSETSLPSITPTILPTKTPIPMFELPSLAPGEYLVDFQGTIDPNEYTLVIYSSDAKRLGSMFPIEYLGWFSPDLKYLVQLPDVIDLTTQERLQIKGIDGCASMSWSPDSKYIIAECGGPAAGVGLYHYSVIDQSTTYIKGCGGETYACADPAWSPDGKWIAYEYGKMASGTSIVNGLHLMDVKCFSSPDTCIREGDPGIHLTSPYAWSPDSQYIAGKRENGVGIFRVVNRTAIYYRTYAMGPIAIWNLSWSPSGKWIAVASNTGVSLIAVDTGKVIPLDMQSFYSWIKVP